MNLHVLPSVLVHAGQVFAPKSPKSPYVLPVKSNRIDPRHADLFASAPSLDDGDLHYLPNAIGGPGPID